MLVEHEHLSLWTFAKPQICPRREKWVFRDHRELRERGERPRP
jgi:hypothetical protein